MCAADCTVSHFCIACTATVPPQGLADCGYHEPDLLQYKLLREVLPAGSVPPPVTVPAVQAVQTQDSTGGTGLVRAGSTAETEGMGDLVGRTLSSPLLSTRRSRQQAVQQDAGGTAVSQLGGTGGTAEGEAAQRVQVRCFGPPSFHAMCCDLWTQQFAGVNPLLCTPGGM